MKAALAAATAPPPAAAATPPILSPSGLVISCFRSLKSLTSASPFKISFIRASALAGLAPFSWLKMSRILV